MERKLSKIQAFEQKVVDGHYKSQPGALRALSRTIKKEPHKTRARKFVEKHFKSLEPTAPKPEKKAVPSGLSFLTAFGRLCKDERRAREIREFLILAHGAHYDIPLLIQAFVEVFDTGLRPIEGQPGLFKDLETGDVVNIRDFREGDKYDSVFVPVAASKHTPSMRRLMESFNTRSK